MSEAFLQKNTAISSIIPIRLLNQILWQSNSIKCSASPNSLNGQFILITGGSKGVGYETARGLALLGAEVVIASRNEEKLIAAKDTITKELLSKGSNGTIEYMILDLSDLDNVISFINEFKKKYNDRKLNQLIQNAAVWPQKHSLTVQGYEIAFGTNVVGPTLLFRKLLSENLLLHNAKVLVLTGDIYCMSNDCTADFPDAKDKGHQAYCRSKLGVNWVFFELVKRYPDIWFNLIHPGVIANELSVEEASWFMKTFLITCEAGAQVSLICSTSSTTDGILERGAYYHNVYGKITLPSNDNSSNPEKAGKTVFIGGVADSTGYGWAIAKACAEAGAKILLGTWPPVLPVFQMGIERGQFEEDSKLSDGSKLEITKIYPLDATFDNLESIPESVATSKRYKNFRGYSIQEVVDQIKTDFGTVDYVVHSLANGPEVTKPLLETSRNGYLAANSASAYSLVSLVSRFGPIINPGGAVISLTYIASEKVIPGYGGGMSSAKAALESDTRTLAFEAGRKYGIRVNTISAGPLASRAAKAIGGAGKPKTFIDYAIDYSKANAPLTQDLYSDDVGATAAFLLSPLARAITGVTLYVDNGLNVMGMALDSISMKPVDEST
eukprot:gene19577-25478_t